MTSGAARFTRRGWGLLAAALAMGTAAVLVGIQELYPVAAAILILLVAARIWVANQGWDIAVSRQVHPVRVPAGYEARVELTVRNQRARRSPPVGASDPFDGGRRWARFAIAPLEPGETRSASYRLPTSKRGVYRLGPLDLELSDPFGLARAVRQISRDTSLTVHPLVEGVSARSVSAHSDHDTSLPLPLIGHGGNEFFALRAYQAGDDLRHVHWASSARVDDLVIRQPENLWRGRITVALDLRSNVHDGETLEGVLSAAATLAISALKSGLQVRVLTTAGVSTGRATPMMTGPAILDGLAAAVTHPGGRLADTFRSLRSNDPLVMITTDGASDDDLAAAFRLGGANNTTLVVFERHPERPGNRADQADGPSLDYAPRSSGRYVRVAPGTSFRGAWEGSRC